MTEEMHDMIMRQWRRDLMDMNEGLYTAPRPTADMIQTWDDDDITGE